jgi:type IV pilus assembly protein PilM
MSFLKKEIAMPKLRRPSMPSRPSRSPRSSRPRPSRSPRAPGSSRPSLRLRPPSRRTRTITGLEIGATQAIAAEAHLENGQIVTERVAARALPHGLMSEGLVIAPDRLAAELRELFAEHKLSTRVRVGLATPRTILRVIDLPPLEEKDIRAALMMQAQERIPMPLDRAVMDFQTVGLVDTPDGRRLRVIVVVTEKEGVERLLATLKLAGLKPEGIDLSIFAVIRALAGVRQTPGPVLYAQLGDLVNIAIAESGVCRFTRQAPQGLTAVLERLAEMRAIPIDEARVLLQTVGQPRPGAGPGGGDQDIFALLSRIAAELGAELRAAAEFYATQFGSGIVSAGVVTGQLAPVPGFVESLAEASGLELVCGEVTAVSPEALGGVDARLAPVASGLAVGKLDS